MHNVAMERLFFIVCLFHGVLSHDCKSNVPVQASEWISSLQLPDGAVLVHHEPGYYDSNGTAWYRAVPYNAGLAVRGMLAFKKEMALPFAQAWLQWYASNINVSHGCVLDLWYDTTHNIGPLACVPGQTECYLVDAEDSAAAMFLGVAGEVFAIGGDVSSLLNALDVSIQTLMDLSRPEFDRLTYAKSDYPLCYTMDNAEVYWGLKMAAEIPQINANAILLRDKVLYGVGTHLLQDNGYYAIGVPGPVIASPLTTWYPDASCQLWPLLFGCGSENDVALWEKLYPSWTCAMESKAGCSIWPSISVAASAMVGNDICSVLDRIRSFPNPPWPFSVDDAGWVLQGAAFEPENEDEEDGAASHTVLFVLYLLLLFLVW